MLVDCVIDAAVAVLAKGARQQGVSFTPDQKLTEWLEAVEWEYRWSHDVIHGNVISWNVGPGDIGNTLQIIKDTLHEGAAVVMVQEIRISKPAGRHIRRQLQELTSGIRPPMYYMGKTHVVHGFQPDNVVHVSAPL